MSIPLNDLQPPRSKSPRLVPELTPKEYAEHVSQFSKVHTGAGQRLVGLADFLNSAPYTVIVDGDDGSKDDAPREQPFMTLYDIDSKQCDASGRLTPVEVSTPDDLATRPLPARNQLVFMKGYPSPLWLNVIGAKFKVDPDFFARHLDFLIPSTSAKFPRPALPSSLSHQVQLLVTTVGSRDCAGKLKQAVLDKLRTEEEDSFDTYKKALSTGSDFQTGCALVRRYGTLDGDQFFIEQKISLVVLMRGDHWTIFVWVDGGNDLKHSIHGPWSLKPDSTTLHPIVMYNHLDALNPRVFESIVAPNRSPSPQTITLLHRRYGQTLGVSDMTSSILYTLQEVFALSTCSEAQFLDLMGTRLANNLNKVDAEEFDSLSDLKYLRQTLYRHIEHMQENIVAYGNLVSLSNSRKGVTSPTEEAQRAACATLRDLEHNLKHAKALDDQYHDAITTLMSSASIAESRKAMAQQEKLAKLTFLAFIFVPLSFTTSFFGMNFKEMQAEKMSLYLWFTVSLPVIGLTQIAFFLTLSQMAAPWGWLRRLVGAGLRGLGKR